jgi:hypothetical protein
MPATLLWFSGLELGTTSEFNNSPDGALEASVVRSGAYAVKFDNELHSAASVQVPGLSAELYVRFYFRPAGAPLESAARIYGAGSSTAKFRLYYNTNGTLKWNYNGTDYDSGANTVVVNDWNLIEIKQVRDAAVGGMELYLNGVLQFSNFTVATTSGSSATNMRFFFGPTWGSMGSAAGSYEDGADTFFDDIAIGTGAYVGAGQCVAVQGEAGAPTHDAWTKSSGSDAHALWSDTPYDSATYCSASVLDDKQTMRVDLGAVGSSATINGARVMARARLEAGGGYSSVKLLRRVGGADTATAALSVGEYADGLIPNGVNGEAYDVFTDTWANLDAAEIGAQDNNGSVVTRVHDVWLLVDYTPGPPSPLLLLPALSVETLGWVARRAALPVEALGVITRNLWLPAPVEALGWVAHRLPALVESWVLLRSRLALPVEADGGEDDALAVLFQVLRASGVAGVAYDPLFVRFSTLATFVEEMGALTVTFSAWRITEDALLVRFDAIDAEMVALATSGAVQAPVAAIAIAPLSVWGAASDALAVQFDVVEP